MGKAKRSKTEKGQFVKQDIWIMRTPAWQSLSGNARALYQEIKTNFNGHNNGKILFSQRMGVDAVGLSRKTVAKCLKELTDKGFIVVAKGHSLGPDGFGKATIWALTEEATPDGRKATYAFKNWKPTDG